MDTSAPSSHVADERTAKPHGASGSCFAQSASSSSSRPSGRRASSISCRASAARAYTFRPDATRRSERGSQNGESPRMAVANAASGSTQVAGTENPFLCSHARRAAFPPTVLGLSPSRASVSSGTSHPPAPARAFDLRSSFAIRRRC